jgi:hypothetical protein
VNHVDMEVFSARILGQTALAFLVKLEDDGREFWIPKSLVEDADAFYPDEDAVVDIEVAEWWATKEGLS